MNVIELAREAGIPTLLFPDGVEELSAAHKRFAALVRAAALEEAADICDRVNNYDNPMTAGDCADAIRALKGTPNVLE
jgi:hypothetical protein